MPAASTSFQLMYNGRRVVLWILLLAAAAEFVVRGPLRYLRPTGWNDLAQYYATSRIWLRGQNFADSENFAAMWRVEVGDTLNAGTPRVRIAPPPGALVLFAPIAALPWPLAKLVWLAILLAGFVATVGSLLNVAGFSFTEPRALAFVTACLALAPFHTGIASGNQSILIVGLCAIGIWAARMECDLIAGLSFGAACSLKPHVAGFLLLYYLLRRRWRLLGTAVAFGVILVLLAVAWMQFAGVNWLPDYLNNIRFSAARNRVDDFTTANPIRFTLINLQVPFYSFTHSPKAANVLAFSVGAVLILVWVILVLRKQFQDSELLSLATIAVIGLLPLYHRLYDASILAIPLCWCLIRRDSLRVVANAGLLLIAPFLVPGATVLQQIVRRGRIPESWMTSWWWDRLLMPHQTWLLLLLSLVLIVGMVESTREGSKHLSC